MSPLPTLCTPTVTATLAHMTTYTAANQWEARSFLNYSDALAYARKINGTVETVRSHYGTRPMGGSDAQKEARDDFEDRYGSDI